MAPAFARWHGPPPARSLRLGICLHAPTGSNMTMGVALLPALGESRKRILSESQPAGSGRVQRVRVSESGRHTLETAIPGPARSFKLARPFGSSVVILVPAARHEADPSWGMSMGETSISCDCRRITDGQFLEGQTSIAILRLMTSGLYLVLSRSRSRSRSQTRPLQPS